MAIPTSINFAITPTFPAQVSASGPISVTKVAGVWTFVFSAADIAINTVPLTAIQQIATDRLLGRDTAATGDVEQLTVGGGIEFTGSGGIQSSAYTGDVTKDAGDTVLTIAAGAVGTVELADGGVTADKIGAGAVTNTKIGADAVDGTKMADDSIDSEHYVDGSIDTAHIAADAIDGTLIADDSVDSEHYVAASIDHEHLADDVISGATAVGTFEAGDKFLVLETGVGLRQADFGDLPAASYASQAEQETGTETAKSVAPGTQQYHPSALKAWISFNGTGTPAARVSYNVSSITDNGTGDYTINFTTAFSSTDYAAFMGMAGTVSTTPGYMTAPYSATPTAAAFRLWTLDFTNNNTDFAYASIGFAGDQ